MELLFRSPLLQFDIRNPDEVKTHWSNLLDSIRLSSHDLYSQIRDKKPENLSAREKMAVYKYLLRGRFRATPFGRWAGVGVARWSAKPNNELKVLTTQLIESPATMGTGTEYWMNPSLLPWGDGWKFWNYDSENGRWRYSKSEDNPVVQRIRSLAYDGNPIDRQSLFAGFPGLIQDEKNFIFEHLLSNQLLVSIPFAACPSDQWHEDQYILQKPEVSVHHKYQLDRLFSEIGKLAVPTPSSYLRHLEELFIDEFDDRFVPLKMLWQLASQLDPFSRMEDRRDIHKKGNFPLATDKPGVLDLRGLDLDYGNIDKVNHVQGLFRVLPDGQILLDNLVYNRPFVYGGRFTHRPEVFEYFKNQACDEDKILLADVMLLEGSKASRISSHRSTTRFRINCFGGSLKPDELDSSDLFLGIEGRRFKLVAPDLGKEVIPVFQHPLNPHYITHPICRMLWEVGHQDLLKPAHYSQDFFLEADYIPQLNWAEIILQPQQWRLHLEGKYSGEKEVMELLSNKGIPKKILVGQLDQELALDLECRWDREVLLEEIRKNKSLRIHEWLWQNPTDQSNTLESKLQYVWGLDLPKHKKDLNEIQQLNYLPRYESKHWVSVRIALTRDFQQSIVIRQLKLLADELEQAGIRTFYYLYYRIKNAEIRLRVKLAGLSEKATVFTSIYSCFEKLPEVAHIKPHPYYPEHIKYSEEGMHISEELFYQESKLLLTLNPRTVLEKMSLAIGLGSLLIDSDDHVDYWIGYFKAWSGEGVGHHSLKAYQLEFFSQTTEEWRRYYLSQARKHPWAGKDERSCRLVGHHLHMVINRIFWEKGLDMEQEVFALLGKVVRKRKFG